MRLKRAVARDPGNRQLTSRDRLVVLPFVGRCGPVSSSQIRRFAQFPSVDTCSRRLRFLRDAGLVFVHTPGGPSGENFYTLAPKGAREVERFAPEVAEVVRVKRDLGRDLAHHQAVVDTYVHAIAGAARAKEVHLLRVELDWELRARAAPTALVPDLTIDLNGSAPQTFLVEVDRGTLNPNRVADKALTYARRRGVDPAVELRVLCVVPSRRRMHILARRLLDEAIPDGFWFFGVDGEINDRTFYTRAWHTVVATGDETAALRLANPFRLTADSSSAGAS